MIPFVKMNGLGNDFVVIDARARPVTLRPAEIRALADRSHGIGFDQLLMIEPSVTATALMRVFNADGGEVSACGNGARCVARLLMEETGGPIRLDSRGGIMAARFADSADSADSADEAGAIGAAGPAAGAAGAVFAPDRSAEQAVRQVAIDMGEPCFDAAAIPLTDLTVDPLALPLASTLPPAVAVNVGNPHAVLFMDDADAVDLTTLGPLLERHPLFAEGANISFATVRTLDMVTVRVWERGAGATAACGTAACAVAAAGVRTGALGPRVTVHLPGGPLSIAHRDGRIVMTGPATLDGTGALPAGLATAAQHGAHAG